MIRTLLLLVCLLVLARAQDPPPPTRYAFTMENFPSSDTGVCPANDPVRSVRMHVDESDKCFLASKLFEALGAGYMKIIVQSQQATIQFFGDPACETPSLSVGPVTNDVCFVVQFVGPPGASDNRLSWAIDTTPPPCFHTSTKINYKGKEYTFEQIEAEPECFIPHVVRRKGVVITHSCSPEPLRLTKGHLVYTQRGLVPAMQILPTSDVIYSDIDNTRECQVSRVAEEDKEQDYFGLNCLNSRVLANGVKTSTFETLHRLPAAWMGLTGRLLGVKRASKWGDKLATVAHKVGLI